MASANDVPVYKHEKPLFVIMLLISLFLWLLLIVGTAGTALAFILIVFLFYLFAQSGFISYIKGTGAKVSPEQFPDLYSRVTGCAERLNMKQVPDAYILHADGIFNALATKFLGRNFIVLFSDIVDALADNPDAINFYIGHELGHIKLKHLSWGPWLWPAGFLPLLGAGYSRARESSCDLLGASCCENPEDARRGLCALAVGSEKWKTMNIESYVQQAESSKGFWMSLHELIGDYPWLVKRMMRLDGKSSEIPSRNIFAWLFAMFIPRLGGMGGGASPLIIVAIIGILAAVAIPAYQDYTVRAHVAQGISYVSVAKSCVVDVYHQTQSTPASIEDCGLSAPYDWAGDEFIENVSIDSGIITMTISESATPKNLAGNTMVFEPKLNDDGGIIWLCNGGTLSTKYRPAACR
jgi:Zn-dependent protease with chaperone function/Tfp pilus assembly protein PilE